eukprot:2771260-Pyramimonas_sp.AAC.1
MFSCHAPSSVDGFHIWHFDDLFCASLEVVAIMREAMGACSLAPVQASASIVSLLAKQAGGFCPIGLCFAIYG